MGFGLNAAMMAGVNDGLRQQENDQFLRDQRAREAKAADLNQQVLTGQVEDMNRARADQAAVRGAAAGAYQSDQATTAAGGIPMGRAGSITAMRDAAAARGDVNTVQQLDSAWKSLQDEGIVAVTKAALMGQDGPELGKVFNSYGTFRVDPATVKVDANGNITGNKADGTPFQGFNLAKMAVLTGLVKPDEYISTPYGPANKRTGMGADGKPLALVKDHPLNSNFTTVKNEDGSERLIDLRQPGATGAPEATGVSVPPSKIRGEIRDAVNDGFRGSMGELTGTPEVKDRQTVLGEQIWMANRNGGMTPKAAAEAARAVQGGKAQLGTFTLSDGSTVKGFEFNGKQVFMGAPVAKPAPATPGGVTPSAPAAPAAMPAVPRPAAGAPATSSAPAAAAPGPARPAGYVEIPPMPAAAAGSKAFDDWNAKYGDQYAKNEELMKLAAQEADRAARERGKGGLKARLKAERGYAHGGPVRKGFGVGAC